MSFALPESMRDDIETRVASGKFGNTSEYARDLVRRGQEEQAKKRLRPDRRGARIRVRPAPYKGGQNRTVGHRSRRDRLKPAVLRTQALRDQQGQVRYYRKERLLGERQDIAAIVGDPFGAP